MNQKLRMELDARVTPAAGALTESLRVANLLTDDMPKARAQELDQLHADAIDLTQRIVSFAEQSTAA